MVTEYLFVCLSVCAYLCVSVCEYLCVSVRVYRCASVLCTDVRLSACYVCLSVYLKVCQSIFCLSFSQSVYLKEGTYVPCTFRKEKNYKMCERDYSLFTLVPIWNLGLDDGIIHTRSNKLLSHQLQLEQ